MENNNSSGSNGFKPYIPADKVMPELTVTSIVLGVILAIVFSAANAYLGLRVGLTVTASVPAAVISMGVLRAILRRDSILENNIVQTIGSVGESIAGGSIFTIPVLFIWAKEWNTTPPDLIQIALIAFVGGILGVVFMVPLRKALIVKEHGTLPYPEGTACAEVLMAGEKGGNTSSIVFAGLGISAGYKFIADGLKIFPSKVHLETNKLGFNGGGFGLEALPALLGVGYICGLKVTSTIFCGGILSWLFIMPLISFFGGESIIAPGKDVVSFMTSNDIWATYIRYIGAGAVATAGIISLIKTLPLIGKTFMASVKSISNSGKESELRTERDIPAPILGFLVLGMFLILWLAPPIPIGFVGAIICIVFSFFFAAISSRVVGIVGASNNPVSGMAIATLLIATFILKSSGITGRNGMTSAIIIGAVICIVAANAGDMSQDLKTGYIVGATPKKQQISAIIGVVVTALTVGFILYLLNAAWGYGSKELPAPQAMLMKVVVEGVMGGNLPWTLVIAGAFIAIAVELTGLSTLSFCVGLYLPIHLTFTMFIGGLVRHLLDKRKGLSKEEKKAQHNRGLLYSSGFIAGEGIIGVVLAMLAIIPLGSSTLGKAIDLSNVFNLGQFGSVVIFSILAISLIWFTVRVKKGKSNNDKA